MVKFHYGFWQMYLRLEIKRRLIKEIDRVNREVEHISEVELLNKMGFPEDWKSITKYHLK